MGTVSSADFPREPQTFVPGNGPVSNYDVWVAPFLRDLDVFVPGVAFFFLVQHGSRYVAHKLLPRFREMNDADQLDWSTRMVAAVNGLLCQRSTYLWLWYLWNMPSDFEYDMYTPLPGYRVPLALLNSYFMWDLIVCIYYKWGAAYTIHAIASGVGMYLCSFQCSALWSPYYAGLFELSNTFFHIGHMIRQTTDQSKTGWRTKIPAFGNAFFVVWFFVVRLGGGLFTSTRWLWLMGNEVAAGRVHNYSAAYVMMPLFASVIGVQFVWARDVIKGLRAAMNGESIATAASDKEPSPTKADKKKDA